jgi:peptide chain release factor subunit 1
MIDYELVWTLLKRSDKKFLTTSLYLDLSSPSFTTKDAEIVLKGLIKEKRQELDGLPVGREEKQSVADDLEKLSRFVGTELQRKGAKGLAVFSSSAAKMWETFPLPGPVAGVLRVDRGPYIRPFTMLLDEYERYCTVLVDRERARVFAVTMGEIEEQSQILDDVPGKVRASGWGGYDERRIERHIEDHVHRHLKHAADVAYELFQRKKFDRLILGGRPEVLADFEKVLHSYLKERISARVAVDASVSLDEAFKRTMEVHRQIEERSDRELVQKMIENARAGGLGVLGLRATLGALRRNQVHTLVLEMGYVEKGVVCDACGFIGTDEKKCPACGAEPRPVADVVEEAIREALRHDAKVAHVGPATDLAKEGRIGAVLRYSLAAS